MPDMHDSFSSDQMNNNYYSAKLSEHVERLTKRRDYLIRRIKESDIELSFDKAEASTLSYVLDFIQSNRDEAVKHLEQYLSIKAVKGI